MALDLKLNLKLSQQLVMTPQLQQAIKLLQLNRMELTQLVNKELVDNPMLEENHDGPEVSSSDQDPEGEQQRDERVSDERGETKELPENKDDFNWDNYIDEYNSNYKSTASMKEINDELPSFESALTKTSTLEDHLQWQLSMSDLTNQEKKFGALVIGNLNHDGYLQDGIEDLAKETEMELEDAEEVLKILQRFDPVGSCSRSLQECLLVQCSFMEPRQPLVEKVVEFHLSDLEKKSYSSIAKALEIPMEKVIETTKLILELEPKPGRSFQSGDTHYISPDIYVYKVGDEYAIVLNEDGLPKLKISSYYKDILSNKQSGDAKQTKDYVQDKLRSALWLIRSIHNRQKTIYKVTEAIVQRQKEFFDQGVSVLKPMILKDVANDIGMHESTISRVTTNKYMHTPVGIFELKYFFNSSISSNDGSDALASEAVKQKIKALVSAEDPLKPLSDQKLVELLKQSNINIARRTVAKYREMLGILSSGKRKKIF